MAVSFTETLVVSGALAAVGIPLAITSPTSGLVPWPVALMFGVALCAPIALLMGERVVRAVLGRRVAQRNEPGGTEAGQ